MERDELGDRVDLVRRLHALGAELAEPIGGDVRVVGDDVHPKAERPPCDLLADSPETEHAEGLAGELDAAVRLPLPASLLQRGVRLRDVARERDEQADGVLGGRDDGGLRRVRDDDAAARRRLDVDVVDADASASDHLQVRRALDDVGSQLRGRADDDRVVPVDDVLERRFEVDIDVEARAQQLDAGVGDRLPDEHFHATELCSYASSAAVTAAPRSMSAPSSARTISTAASALVMSKTSNQPMWPMRKIFPFRSACPFARVMPKRLRTAEMISPESMPSGLRTAVTTALRSSSGENSSRPIAFAPARAAQPRRTWRSNAFSSPSSRRRPSATSSAATSETGGVNGASSFRCAVRVRSQSK